MIVIVIVIVIVRAMVGANVSRLDVRGRCRCRLPVGLQQIQGQLPVLALQAGHGTDGLVQPGGARLNFVSAAQVGFVEHQQIGGAQLAQQAVVQQRVCRVSAHGGGVHHHQHAMQAQAFVRQRDLGDGPGVGHAAGFDDDGIKGLRRVQHLQQGLAQVAANLAADATVAQRDGVAVAFTQQFGVDVDGAKVVDQYRNALSLCLL